MAVDKGYMSGSSRMLVLSLLVEKSYYGYELIKTLKSDVVSKFLFIKPCSSTLFSFRKCLRS